MLPNPLPAYETALHIESAVAEDNGIHIAWTDGHASFFHNIWLRDCCYCAECGDCYSSKRFFVPCDAPLDIRPQSIAIGADGSLHIEWAPDGHPSAYDAAWLRRHCYDDASRAERRHVPILWDSSLVDAVPTADFETANANETARMDLYR